MGLVRWTPHPVIVTEGDNRDYIKVLLYSYYTAITGWGVLLRDWTVSAIKGFCSPTIEQL